MTGHPSPTYPCHLICVSVDRIREEIPEREDCPSAHTWPSTVLMSHQLATVMDS